MNIRERVKALLAEGEALAAKADPVDADFTRIEEIIAERGKLESQMKALDQFNEFKDWAGKSAGVVNLVGLKRDGEVTVTQDAKGRKSVLLTEDSEPVIDRKVYDAISSDEYKRGFRNYIKTGDAKALQVGLDASGGYFAPEDMQNRVIQREPTPTNLAGRVTTLNTSRDSIVMPSIPWTTDNLYTNAMRVTWTGEIPVSATTHRVTEPTFGQVRIPIYTAMMSLPVTLDMLEDSAFDIMGWASSKFSETIVLLKDNMIVNGTGVAQPSGILINANFVTNDVHTGAAAALTWDGLVDLTYALPEQYDNGSAFYMNKTNCARALAKLVDGNGRPFWGLGSQDEGLSAMRINKPLFGYPVIFNAFMPNVSAGLYPIIFGDLRGYYLVNRIGFSIQVLRELYAETNQVLLLGRVRFGGQLVEDWRLRGHVVSA